MPTSAQVLSDTNTFQSNHILQQIRKLLLQYYTYSALAESTCSLYG